MEGKLLFVYGTLRKGDCRFGIPSFIKNVYKKSYLKGFQLFNLGAFPGIMIGHGRVKGEVQLYSDFKDLDRIEGFYEEQPDLSLFIRQKVLVEVPNGEIIQTSVYVFKGIPNKKYRVIESGDWFDIK